jgi:hypothetical protein
LIQAYHVAAEGHDLEYFKTMLLDHQKALQEDQERREAREAAKAEKAERVDKKKRKSVAAEDDEDVDMEDAEQEGKVEPKKSSKKRKKEVESDGDDEKVCFGSQIWLISPLTFLAVAGENSQNCDQIEAHHTKSAWHE